MFPTHQNPDPGSQSDSSFEDPVYPVGNAETPIAIVIVDLVASAMHLGCVTVRNRQTTTVN